MTSGPPSRETSSSPSNANNGDDGEGRRGSTPPPDTPPASPAARHRHPAAKEPDGPLPGRPIVSCTPPGNGNGSPPSWTSSTTSARTDGEDGAAELPNLSAVVIHAEDTLSPTPSRTGSHSEVAASVPSPIPVTLLGAAGDLRRKRIKKVSHYILGPLLGEGVYGVVRDAVDIAATPHDFLKDLGSRHYLQRCAVKMVTLPRSPLPPPAHGLPRETLTRERRLREAFENEIENLQRFHNTHLIRAHDIFSRYGKEYVVLPIAMCSLQQLMRETMRREERDRVAGSPHGGSPSSGLEWSKGRHLPSEEDDGDSASTRLELASSRGSRGSARPPEALARGPGSEERLPGASERAEAGQPIRPILSPILIKGIMYQVFSGLLYLHAQGIAHNDVKPTNILLFENGSVKLTDLGSVGATYNDRGTPLFAAPELCQSYYGVESPGGGGGPPSAVDPTRSDMWCCGMVLYFLLTGRHGPLPVHRQYDSLSPTERPRGPRARTRFELYRLIASQCVSLSLEDVPEMRADPVEAPASREPMSSWADGDAPPSARHLLSGLLAVDPAARLTAAEALAHPWMRATFKPPRRRPPLVAGAAAVAPPAASVDDAIQRDVARRVLQSPPVQAMMERDRRQHLQFVADCCHTLGLPLPRDILQLPEGAVAGAGTGFRPPAHPPSPCVDPDRFLDAGERDYYERKGGRSEFDVYNLRSSPFVVKKFQEYLHNVVLVQAGYRTEPDPVFVVYGEDGDGSRGTPTGQRPGSPVGRPSSTAVARPARGPRQLSSGGSSASGPASSADSPMGRSRPPSKGTRTNEPSGTESEISVEQVTVRESSKCLCGLL